MAFYVDAHRCNLIPTLSYNCACQRRPSSSKALVISRPSTKLKLTWTLGRCKEFVVPRRMRRFCIATDGHILEPEAGIDSNNLNNTESNEEVSSSHSSSEGIENLSVKSKGSSQFKNRVIFGVAIGVGFGGVVLAGGWIFTVAIAAAVFTGTREYFELLRSRRIAQGMTPPPRYVSRACSVICAVMPLVTLYLGHIDVSVTLAAFVVAMALLLQKKIPRFSQLSSALFGLFYCGYLPCFWVKLRCGLTAPALNTKIGAAWPILLGGPTQWTVGLVATLISISSIIAADTFAYLGGKTFGRTPLTDISPKKTWEGTLAGFSGCIATALVLSKVFCWPANLLSAAAFGFLNFVGSLLGDLIESMIKRDAGVKDSGSLIPGHGGILDRVDSYMFTGALAYSFVKAFLPLYGL